MNVNHIVFISMAMVLHFAPNESTGTSKVSHVHTSKSVLVSICVSHADVKPLRIPSVQPSFRLQRKATFHFTWKDAFKAPCLSFHGNWPS